MCLTFSQQGHQCVSHFRSRTLHVSHIFAARPSMCLTFSQKSLLQMSLSFLCLLNLPFQNNWNFNLKILFYFFKQLNITDQLAIWHFFRKAPHWSHGRRRSGKTTEHKLYCIPKIREKTHFMQCLVAKFKLNLQNVALWDNAILFFCVHMCLIVN